VRRRAPRSTSQRSIGGTPRSTVRRPVPTTSTHTRSSARSRRCDIWPRIAKVSAIDFGF
jgi:hypothetical protein